MNENDLKKLENLNERYTAVNMTGFKLVKGHRPEAYRT